ncbi:hypothetical protein JOM56_009766 [Amanita muscaria]
MTSIYTLCYFVVWSGRGVAGVYAFSACYWPHMHVSCSMSDGQRCSIDFDANLSHKRVMYTCYFSGGGNPKKETNLERIREFRPLIGKKGHSQITETRKASRHKDWTCPRI